MNKPFCALFIGLGSIGTRHLKNLAFIASEQGFELKAYALRSSQRALSSEVAALLAGEYTDYSQLGHYDAAFITNPTNLHFDTLKLLINKADTLFIEKPIFDKTNYALSECIAKSQKAYVAAPMRYCGTFLALKELLPRLKVYSARVICSSYLPDWRKGVDYRTVYSAHKEMGGGVTIDLIHEWDYLTCLFGLPQKIYNFKGQYSHLEINSDDLSIYMAQYSDKLVEVHLDYFGRNYRRAIELFCEKGTVTADFGEGFLTYENGKKQFFKEDLNERYLREMREFLLYATTDAGCPNSAENGLCVLKLTLGEF